MPGRALPPILPLSYIVRTKPSIGSGEGFPLDPCRRHGMGKQYVFNLGDNPNLFKMSEVRILPRVFVLTFFLSVLFLFRLPLVRSTLHNWESWFPSRGPKH